ncbi:MAG: cation transporter [Coprococcus sp.]|nr:cation transporter [Coprococcus sp.]
MKKRFNLSDVDCANCAAKMEEGIKKLPGVNDASISFMAQKLTLDYEEDKLDDILKAAEKIIKDIDEDASIEY